jgi:D-3-phosphoglycerate dehydrogenase
MFRIGVTSDFQKPDGTCGFGDIGLDRLNRAGIEWQFFCSHDNEIQPEDAARFDGLLVLGARVTRRTLSAPTTPRIVARFGVGYDNVDVTACTEAGSLLTITPEGVRRPVAVGAMTLMLALSLKLRIKDQLTRAGRWSEKLDYHGQGVTGRTLGIIGFGNIGRELARMVAPLEMQLIASDPNWDADAADSLRVKRVSLPELLQQSDYVVICCALCDATHHLIGKRELALMKPTAYLINVARGPIVDQRELTRCLQNKSIAGAALDVFEVEPIAADDPLLKLDNTILTPHAMSWTDECFRLIGRSAIDSLLDVADGRLPPYIVNREVLNHPRWK